MWLIKDMGKGEWLATEIQITPTVTTPLKLVWVQYSFCVSQSMNF